MSKNHFDVVVVGAGIFGSCAAYHSQKLGLRTLLVEQFAFGHKNGSSHGQSRIIRYAHTQEQYVPLVHDAYQQIAELEKKRSEELWRKTGLLWTAPKEQIENMSLVLKRTGIDHETIAGSQIASRYHQFKYDDSVSALIDPMGGVLFADKWINAFQEEFREAGGVVQHDEEVLNVNDGSTVEIVTKKGSYTAGKAIVTAGPWIAKLIPSFPINVEPQSMHVCYFKAKKEEDKHKTEMGTFPVFIGSKVPGQGAVFGLPAVEYPHLIKVVAHRGAPIGHGADHGESVQKFVDIPSAYVDAFLPIIDKTVQKMDRCKYTMSDDAHYVIDKLPNSQNIIIGGCGSGSGFKTAPGIGRALAELAAGKQTSVDVSFFSFKRLL